MRHIILSDPPQTFGIYWQVLPSNKFCFRQILKSVKIILTLSLLQQDLRCLEGPGKWLLSHWGTGCQGRRETSPVLLFVLGIFHWLLELYLPTRWCPRRLACLVSITGFLLSGFWLSWTLESRIDPWDRKEDRVFISWLSLSWSLELAVSLQKIMASLKG